MTRTPAIVMLTVAAAVVAPRAAPEELAPAVRTLLQTHLGFSDRDLRAVAAGETVARVLEPGHRREVVVAGAVRVRAPLAVYVERVRDIVNFKRGEQVPEIGLFGRPPRLTDLDGLTIDRADVDALRRCEPGECKVRLPAGAMMRLRAEAASGGPDAYERTSRLFKQILVEYVQRYLAGGNAALNEYHDQDEPLSLSDEFRSILAASPGPGELAPEVQRYLRDFPDAAPRGVEDFVYWSKESFGMKPIVNVTHVTLAERPDDPTVRVLIVSKQIYASHYFDASLALTALVPDPAGDGFYLVYLNRSRNAKLGGFIGRIARPIVQRRVRDGMASSLHLTRLRVEGAAKLAPQAPPRSGEGSPRPER